MSRYWKIKYDGVARPRSITDAKVQYFQIMGQPGVVYYAYTTVTNNDLILGTFIYKLFELLSTSSAEVEILSIVVDVGLVAHSKRCQHILTWGATADLDSG